MRITPFVCTLSAVVVFAANASASTVTSTSIFGNAGIEGLGAYTGTITYDTAGLLEIMLENTSPAANGGYITGFVFDVDADVDLSLSLTPDPAPFQFVQNESGSPFGTFDFGAALGGNFLGGGNPTGGIAVGDSRMFVFNVSGSDAGLITASDFVDSGFLVRFRGFEDGGSDKVPGTVVPTPAAALAGIAMLGMLGLRRRQH
jgi:MYXO-CTERM domain-containing protein